MPLIPNYSLNISTSTSKSQKKQLIQQVTLNSTEQQRVLLGSFTGDNPPKGFLIEVTPDPTPEDSVLTEVTRLGTKNRYKLILHIANYSVRTVSVDIRKL